jgi:threonine/homoserine/homoserine lactone efflux protein
MSLTFWLTSLVIVLIPGTGALYTVGTGLVRGWRAAALAAFACTLGIVPHLVAAVTGLAALLHASGVAFGVVKYAGVAYLLYMAWSTWRETGTLGVPEETEGGSAWRVIRTGITINLLNPKLTVFFFAFLPQFVPPGSTHQVVHMLGLSAIFMVLTFVVFVGYGALAAAARERVLARPQVLSRLRKAFAGTFVLLSGRLAFESRG